MLKNLLILFLWFSSCHGVLGLTHELLTNINKKNTIKHLMACNTIVYSWLATILIISNTYNLYVEDIAIVLTFFLIEAWLYASQFIEEKVYYSIFERFNNFKF